MNGYLSGRKKNLSGKNFMRNTKTIWSGAADLLKSRELPLPYRFKNEASEAKKKWKLAE
jgi:hypothetical protein